MPLRFYLLSFSPFMAITIIIILGQERALVSSPLFIFKDMKELNRLRIVVWLTHRINHQDIGEKWIKRSHLVEEIVKLFRELEIHYCMLSIDINVYTMPPLNATGQNPLLGRQSKLIIEGRILDDQTYNKYYERFRE